jgi:hypothetical protein
MVDEKMDLRYVVILILLSIASQCFAQTDKEERHIYVSMRMIGHEILLNSGDSISRVLPIEKNADRYKISFDVDFQFDPEEMVSVIDRVVKEAGIASHYLVEVEHCESGEVVYSYEIGKSTQSDIIPCKSRNQPSGCYYLMFTILERQMPFAFPPNTGSEAVGELSHQANSPNYITIALLLILFLSLLLLFFYYRKKRRRTEYNPDIIHIGKYQYDIRNMKLSFENKAVELSGKEADLLFLLHSFANDTVEREIILKNVWGDDGDYVGRTLDVFISKLRKKLEADSSIRIVNIRGVGYKLVLNQ